MAEGEQRDSDSTPDNPVCRMVVEFATPLYRYAFRLTGSAADAEDLVQQTFLVAQTRLEQLRDSSRLSAWLHSILRHCWCKQCRRERIHGEAMGHLVVNGFQTGGREDEIDREQIQAALNDLPPDFRLVILMYFFEDLSYQEIASQLEVPIGTVMSRLSRAKQHLRQRLQGEAPATVKLTRIAPDSRNDIPNIALPIA